MQMVDDNPLFGDSHAAVLRTSDLSNGEPVNKKVRIYVAFNSLAERQNAADGFADILKVLDRDLSSETISSETWIRIYHLVYMFFSKYGELYNEDFLGECVEKLLRFCKGRSEKFRKTVYRLFCSWWKSLRFETNPVSTLKGFLTLTA